MHINCIEKPIDFDKAQLAKCRQCRMASKAVRWCGKWSCDIGYPSKIQMAKSFGNAVIKQTRAGNPKRTPEQIAEIMRICEQCPSYVSKDERCRKCGCGMPRKISWATMKCPIRKW